jgi:predicted MFS family arabinose efflux permease
MGIIIIPLVMRYLSPMNEHLHAGKKDNPLQVLKNVLSSRLQLTALALSGCLMLGHFLIIPFLNPYMEFNVGFTAHQRNLIYMVGGVASFVGAPVIGKLADKYGKHRIFTIFALLSLIPIFLITNMPAIKYYYVLMVTGVWFMLSTGRGIPAQAIISNVVAPEQRGSFMSFNSCIQQLFTGAASLIAGMVIVVGADNKLLHYSWTGYLSIAVVLLCVFIAAKIPGESNPRETAREELQKTV